MREILKLLSFYLIAGFAVLLFWTVYRTNKDFKEALKEEDEEFTFIG